MVQEPRRDAEIDHLDLAGLNIEHDAGGVEILVHHMLAMNLPQDRGNTTSTAARPTSMCCRDRKWYQEQGESSGKKNEKSIKHEIRKYIIKRKAIWRAGCNKQARYYGQLKPCLLPAAGNGWLVC